MFYESYRSYKPYWSYEPRRAQSPPLIAQPVLLISTTRGAPGGPLIPPSAVSHDQRRVGAV